MTPAGRTVGSAGVGWRSARVVAAVVVRPDLWATAAKVALRLAAPGWWHQWPPRPDPPGEYQRFRLETMYGRDAALAGHDVVAYLRWCRRIDRQWR